LRNLAKKEFRYLFQPHVNSTFDLLTPMLNISCPYHVEHTCQFAQKRLVRFQNLMFTSLVTDKRMDEQTTRDKNIMALPASLAWRQHKKTTYNVTIIIAVDRSLPVNAYKIDGCQPSPRGSLRSKARLVPVLKFSP